MKKFPYKPTLKRYRILALFFTLLAVAVIGKAAYTMFVKRSFWVQLSERNVKEGIKLPSTRGNIFSADGQLLATSLPEFKVYIDFIVKDRDSLTQVKAQHFRDSVFNNEVDSLAIGLNRIFPKKTISWFKNHLMQGYAKKSRHWVVYPYRMSYMDYKDVCKLPFLNRGKLKSGVHSEVFNETKKPFGSLASRTLGDMYPGKDSARSGLQLAYDSLLRGTPGIYHRQKIRNKYLNIIDVPPVEGADVMTTLDVKMQDFAEKALMDKMKEIDGIDGVVLLMEVATGNIKAIVNLSKCGDGEYRERKNIAVSNLMEPGSVFKPMSFLVALNDGNLKITDRVDCVGGQKMMYGRKMKDHNWHRGGYGVLTVSECLEYSSNIGVSTFIDKIYHNNPEKFVDGLYRLGIAEDLHLDIPGYAPPVIRRPRKDRTGKHWANWYNTALPWMSIGYETQVPPISVLSFYNGIANNGKMMRPRFVTAAMRKNEIIQEFPPQVVREQMASPKAIKDLQICLRRVVGQGLGKKAGSKYFHVSGKTGTAQVWAGGGKTANFLVSFAGYFPSEKPQYSCMVCILKRGLPASGGGQCGPVFKKVAEMVMKSKMRPEITAASDTLHNHLPLVGYGKMDYANTVLKDLGYNCHMENNADTASIGNVVTERDELVLKPRQMPRSSVVPDLTGMGARDAVYLAEQLGLKVQIEGTGVVQQQSLPFGHIIVKGEKIKLHLGLKGSKNVIEKASVEKVDNQEIKPDTTQKAGI
ncbi:MAG TPA: penicillin-binding protein [Prevotellaceae bacterium]|nr:penicillin-binding protein [Prevotellaceae bacterium]